jgi:hypothetical protein
MANGPLLVEKNLSQKTASPFTCPHKMDPIYSITQDLYLQTMGYRVIRTIGTGSYGKVKLVKQFLKLKLEQTRVIKLLN